MNVARPVRIAPTPVSQGLLMSGAFLGIFVGIHSSHVYTLGSFIAPIQAEFGWTRAQASAGAAISFVGTGLAAPFAGRLLDRFGSLKVAAVSLPGLALGFTLLALLTDSFELFLMLSVLLCIVGAGTGTYTFSRLIILNFDRRRGLALGTVLTATGFGGAIFPYFLIPLIAEQGWRAAYFALAASVLIVSPVLLLLIAKGSGEARIETKRRAESPPFRELAKNPAFTILGLMFLVSAFAVLGTTVQFVSMLADAGFRPRDAATIAAFIGWGAIATRLIAGWLLDKLSPPIVTAAIFTICAAGMFLLSATGTDYVLIGAVLAGAAIGAEGDLLAFMVARYFPLRAYGTVLGAMFLIFNVGGAAGPVVAGHLKDLTGNYGAWLMLSGLCLLTSALLVLGLLTPHFLRTGTESGSGHGLRPQPE